MRMKLRQGPNCTKGGHNGKAKQAHIEWEQGNTGGHTDEANHESVLGKGGKFTWS
jgi:hypothetical protein